MSDVNGLLNGTLAGRIAQALDIKDGTRDGKITASVWNEFVSDKGGKTINNYISVENAMNSITSYVCRNAKSANTAVNELAKSWFSGLGVEIPSGDPVTSTEASATKTKSNATKTSAESVKTKYGTILKSEKNDKGQYTYIKYDKNGDGKVDRVVKQKFYENGKLQEKWVDEDADGQYDVVYALNENGKVQEKWVDADANNYRFDEYYVYDENGKVTEKCVDENADGKTDVKYVYDKDGNVTEKWVNTDASNGVFDVKYVYDKDGKVTEKWVDTDASNNEFEEKYINKKGYWVRAKS